MTRLTRKEFLKVVGSTALWASTARTSLAAAPWADQARRDRIAKVIREFDSQGDHRTGTPVDQENGRWLSDWVRGAGVEPEAERLPFSKIDMLHTYVEVGDRWAEGVPLFDGAFTDADGVTGVLGGIDDDGAIGVTRAGPRPGADFSRYRGTTRQRAVIAITGGAQSGVPDGIALMNTPAYTEPFGPVGLQVATHEGPWLEAAAQRRAEARLVAHVDRRQVEVFNVVATVEGREPAIDPLVVMTPRSGWWTCASERGGGIAVWLEMLRALHAVRPRRSSIFVASTGHELGHVGLDHFLKRRRALIRSAVAWIHLGANFGTAIGGAPRLQASDDALQQLALDAMDAAGQRPDRLHPVGTPPLGEARNIHDGGGRYISLLGGNGLFHHPHDRWPVAVDVGRVARFADSFVNIAIRLTDRS